MTGIYPRHEFKQAVSTLGFWLVTGLVGVYGEPGRRIRKTYAVVATGKADAIEQAHNAMIRDRGIISVPSRQDLEAEQKQPPVDLDNVWANDGRPL